MSLRETITVVLDTVTYTLNKVYDKEGASAWFGRTTERAVSFEVNHSYPAFGKVGPESHLLKLIVTDYDASGGAVSRHQCHMVLKTLDDVHDSALLGDMYTQFAAVLTSNSSEIISGAIDREV